LPKGGAASNLSPQMAIQWSALRIDRCIAGPSFFTLCLTVLYKLEFTPQETSSEGEQAISHLDPAQSASEFRTVTVASFACESPRFYS
jgi:hypothetical protein